MWGFHGGVNIDSRVGCCAVYCFGCVQTFQRDILPPSSGLKWGVLSPSSSYIMTDSPYDQSLQSQSWHLVFVIIGVLTYSDERLGLSFVRSLGLCHVIIVFTISSNMGLTVLISFHWCMHSFLYLCCVRMSMLFF